MVSVLIKLISFAFKRKNAISWINSKIKSVVQTFHSSVAFALKNIEHRELYCLRKIHQALPMRPTVKISNFKQFIGTEENECSLSDTWILLPYLIFLRKSTSGSSLAATDTASALSGTPSSFLVLKISTFDSFTTETVWWAKNIYIDWIREEL